MDFSHCIRLVPEYVDRVRMGKLGECYHARLVSLIQYILCFVFLILRSEPRDYMKYIMKSINMSCLTPEGAMSGDCEFLSANMYPRSLFGNHRSSSVPF
jgi:Coatomer beta subunit appendage platform